MASGKEKPAKKLVKQPHGGAICEGNPRRNGGRPPNALRAKFREAGWKGIEILEKELARILRMQRADKAIPVKVVIDIVEICGKYGLRDEIDVTSNGKPISLTNEERAARALAILDLARARRAGSDPGEPAGRD